MLMHNTFYVPGHFHATVVVGTTLAFMSITYLLVPTVFKREMIFPKLCQIQPYLYGLSMIVLSLVMMGAGTLGVSRRHWDMAFSGAPFQYEWPGAAYLMMGLTGIFGVIAVIGGGLWILLVVVPCCSARSSTAVRPPTRPCRSRIRASPPALPIRQRRACQRSGYGGPGNDLAGLLRPLLLRELEVPVRSLGLS